MKLKNIFLLALSICLFSCKKTHIKDQIETPRGFIEYTKSIKPNDKKNLFFFHLHHCPNCALVLNHLIKSDEFQEITKDYNRYFLELGRPLGKELMEKYSIRGAPVFVLADKDFKILSTSKYGLLSFTDFSSWLQTGKISAPAEELKSLTNITKKFGLTEMQDSTDLYKVFSELEKSTDLKINWDEFIDYSDQTLQKWSTSKFDSKDVYANHYRLGLSYMLLAELSKSKIDNDTYTKMLRKALEEYEKINSGNVKADVGSYMFQMSLYIKLNNDKKVNKLVTLLEKENPSNKTLLYIGLANSYLNTRKDCKKVFEYTSKMKLEDIPTPADRIYQVYFRAQCHEKTKDLVSLKAEYNELLESLGDSYLKAFPDKLEKIETLIKKLEKIQKAT